MACILSSVSKPIAIPQPEDPQLIRQPRKFSDCEPSPEKNPISGLGRSINFDNIKATKNIDPDRAAKLWRRAIKFDSFDPTLPELCRIENYDFKSCIGRGRFGKVFLAEYCDPRKVKIFS